MTSNGDHNNQYWHKVDSMISLDNIASATMSKTAHFSQQQNLCATELSPIAYRFGRYKAK
jgi:hypothetical protein